MNQQINLFMNLTILSEVIPPFSYKIQPTTPLLEIAETKVNFLKTLLSFVFLTQRLPSSHLEYEAVISACIEVSSILIIL